MNSQTAQEYVEKQNWRFAKTYAKTFPHEYLVRPAGAMEKLAFYNMVEHIRAEGYEDNFFTNKYIYLKLNGYKYWTMGNPVSETMIINREKYNED